MSATSGIISFGVSGLNNATLSCGVTTTLAFGRTYSVGGSDSGSDVVGDGAASGEAGDIQPGVFFTATIGEMSSSSSDAAILLYAVFIRHNAQPS